MNTHFLSLSQIRKLEDEALSKHKLDLMDLAAESIKDWVLHNLPKPKKIIVLVGKGNNGGDGVSSAIKLKMLGYQVSIVVVQKTVNVVTKRLIDKFKQEKGRVLARRPKDFNTYDVILDAILGIGVRGELDGELVSLINLVNQSGKFVLALDTPTGLNPFTAEVANAVINADHTITFICDKPGFYTGHGVDLVGGITVASLVDVTTYSLPEEPRPIYLNSLSGTKYKLLCRHKQNTSKGNFGFVAIIGGAKGMHGALYLAGRAAMLLGAGKVILGSLDPNFQTDHLFPELMLAEPKDILKNLDNYTAVIIGPGMGKDAKAVKLLSKLIEQNPKGKFIFDADALNILAANPDLHYKFKNISNKVMTPHPGEAARLLDSNIMTIQQNRFLAIAKLHEVYQATVLLKGSGSLIANDLQVYLNETGNCALSNGGQGDVLSGMVAAFAAQGLVLDEALRLAVYLHGLSADSLVADEFCGYTGVLASEVILRARRLLNQILALE